MMTNHWFFWLFLTLFVVHEAWEMGLDFLNRAHIKRHQNRIPNFYQNSLTPQEYERSIAYTLDKSRFGLTLRLLGIGLIGVALLSGVFDVVDRFWADHLRPGSLTHSVVYCLTIGLALTIIQIPASLYSTFVLEEKYGFNRSRPKVFVTDFIKSLALGLALGTPLLYLLFWLFQVMGDRWWIAAFATVFGFQFFLAAIYPAVLAPLFNKFTPLHEGELKASIEDIARRIGFKMSGIYTIDGSKRSAHSNAYFAGMGRMRRIVLFDTLEKQMNNREIVAILAHEMGHNIEKHIQKMMILSFLLTLGGFWVLSLLMGWEPFFAAFNAGTPAPHKALVLFALFSGYFTFILTPILNTLSRKHEYEADRFSAQQTGDPSSLASSLVKLSKENLANLTPHPLYSFYHYSHPTTEERVKALVGTKAQAAV